MKHKLRPKDLTMALFSVSEKNQVLEEVRNALLLLSGLASTNSYFRVFFQSKKITGNQKVDILNNLLGDKGHPLVNEVVSYLNASTALSDLKRISKLFDTMFKDSKNILTVHGLTNIPKENRFHLANQEEVSIYGDQRAVYINGSEKNIIEIFSSIPGRLIDRTELNLLLPVPENDFVESLYPDFCFLVEDKNIIYPQHLKTELTGYHGGLSTEEIKIPIIEISNF